jgi:hypothetical protein
MHVHFRHLAVSLITVCLAACSGPREEEAETGEAEIPDCVEYELDGCMALYPATYDQVWTQTFTTSCGTPGSACHAQSGSGGAEGGLTFVDPQMTWDFLTSNQLVVPGDPLCSPLFVRLATDDPQIRMPPGQNGLSAATLCSIGTWISDGAEYVAP